ncbi:MAG: ATP-binding cassette domain-containing protein [Alphaproteobacteria bacterium]|nr:ATP-binding cassette domain-containing protein [Alphaproteobacteria bacterium]
MAVASFPFLYAFYELPKRIVNNAIQAKNTAFPVEVLGVELTQIDFLFVLCGLFLLLVLINQAFKYAINVYRGLTGERMLRRLRYDLYWRVLRFPQPTFRKLSQGEIIQMINAEVEPLGGFIGDAFSVPAFQGGTLLVIFGFVVYQNVWLAAAAVMFYPLQFYIIPKLQRRVNAYGKERVRLARGLSNRIGETVSGVQEVHVHNAARLELATFSRRLGAIFEVRFRIYLWKFVIKFINNTVNHLGPFFFYSIGGYLVIQGRLELGTLVAVIAANKDLAAPWKELLSYYQMREDARIKYEQVIEQFDVPEMMEPALQLDEPETVEPLKGAFAASSLRLEDETGHVLVEGASFRIEPGQHVAIVGAGGSGKDHLALMLARLVGVSGGSLTLDGKKLADLPEPLTGRRMAYVGPVSHLVSAPLRDNLYYGLKHRPLIDAVYEAEGLKSFERHLREAEASGNSTDDPDADWVDYEAAGVDGAEALTGRAIEVLSMVDMENDVYQFGLRGTIDPEAEPDTAARILEARGAFLRRLDDAEIASLVEVFDPERYNDNATVAENLLFGLPVGRTFAPDRLAENPYVLEVLEIAKLDETMLEAGRHVASTMVELFADLAPGHEFFERYSFIGHEELPEYQAMLSRIGREGVASLRPEERTRLLALPFRLIPARHRLDAIDDGFKQRLLEARRIFADDLPPEYEGAVARFDRDHYNAAASLQDNILFGKAAYGPARGAERISRAIAEVVDRLDLREAVMAVGLGFHVGIAGGRLSSVQRQKLAIARSVLKRPDVLVLNEATATLDGGSQGRAMERILAELEGRTVIWSLHRASLARSFDRVLVMAGGAVVEQGAYEELDREGSTLRELVEAE